MIAYKKLCFIATFVVALCQFANGLDMMMAVVATAVGKKEGDFSNVFVRNVSIPTPKVGQVLIKVAASSVNPVDWKILAGGLPLKFPHTLGFDVSGRIVKCNGCKRLKVNDYVWADLGKICLLYTSPSPRDG